MVVGCSTASLDRLDRSECGIEPFVPRQLALDRHGSGPVTGGPDPFGDRRLQPVAVLAECGEVAIGLADGVEDGHVGLLRRQPGLEPADDVGHHPLAAEVVEHQVLRLDALSEEEIKNVLAFCKKFGLDYGEIDALRDAEDKRLYLAVVGPFDDPARFEKLLAA